MRGSRRDHVGAPPDSGKYHRFVRLVFSLRELREFSRRVSAARPAGREHDRADRRGRGCDTQLSEIAAVVSRTHDGKKPGDDSQPTGKPPGGRSVGGGAERSPRLREARGSAERRDDRIERSAAERSEASGARRGGVRSRGGHTLPASRSRRPGRPRFTVSCLYAALRGRACRCSGVEPLRRTNRGETC